MTVTVTVKLMIVYKHKNYTKRCLCLLVLAVKNIVSNANHLLYVDNNVNIIATLEATNKQI